MAIHIHFRRCTRFSSISRSSSSRVTLYVLKTNEERIPSPTNTQYLLAPSLQSTFPRNMSSTAPTDKVVAAAIISALNSFAINVRPNKLRKIVCKQVNGTNWTQYAKVLDGLIEEKQIQTGEHDGEKVLLAVGNDPAGNATAKGKDHSNSHIAVPTKTATMEIATAVGLHLIKKGHKKKKNVELNTKTKLKMRGCDGTKQNNDLNAKVQLVITAEYSQEEDLSEEEKEAVAQKRIKAAIVLIESMVKAYAKHPEHFIPKKSGGTFAEQDEAKKKKEAMFKKSNKKRTSDHDEAGKTTKSSSSSKDAKAEKKRKFY